MAPPRSGRSQASMTAIAIFSTDSVVRRNLEHLLREDPTMTVVGVAGDRLALLQLMEQNHVDAVLADFPPRQLLADWRIRHDQTVFVVLVDEIDEDNSRDALYAGARAILPRSSERNEIVVEVKAVAYGLVVFPRELLPMLLNGGSDADELLDGSDALRAQLTARELEVLTAVADGASNKATTQIRNRQIHHLMPYILRSI
jgi:DNA-binding NarL/FixJ family response regulator